MKMLFLLLFSLLSVLPLHATSTIEECFTIERLLTLAKPHSNQLILLDIDNTLLHPKQMLGSDEWFTYYLKKEQSLYGKSDEVFFRVLDLWQAIHTVSEVVPMEAKTVQSVRSLQNKGCTVMVLTTRGAPFHYATLRQFASLGINVRNSAPSGVKFTLQKMPAVLFADGILFTDGMNKGQALKEFLRQIGQTPEEIIFINDKRDHLDEVASGLPEKIRYIGLRYALADERIASFNPLIAEKQLEHFIRIPLDLDVSQ